MPKEAKMPGIRFYLSELELMENMLDATDFMDVILGLKNYVKNGEDPTYITNTGGAVYYFLRDRVEADMRSYKETCEKNKLNAQKRWEAEKLKEAERDG